MRRLKDLIRTAQYLKGVEEFKAFSVSVGRATECLNEGGAGTSITDIETVTCIFRLTKRRRINPQLRALGEISKANKNKVDCHINVYKVNVTEQNGLPL